MPMIRRCGFALLMLLVCASCAVAQGGDVEQVNLQPRFEAGRESRFEMWGQRTQNVEMEFFGQEHAATNTIESTTQIHWIVKKVKPDGSAQCVMQMEWIVFTLTGDSGEKIEIDTRKGNKAGPPQAAHMTELFVAMTKAPVDVSVAADGTVTAVDVAAVAKHAKAEEETAKILEKNYMEYASRLATLPHAPKSLAIGGGWDAKFDWAHDMGTLKYDSAFELQSVENIADIPIANVTIESKNKMELDRLDEAKQAGAKVNVKKNVGSETTQVMFDLQRGEVVGYNSQRELLVEVHISQEGQTMKTRMQEYDQGQILRIEEVK